MKRRLYCDSWATSGSRFGLFGGATVLESLHRIVTFLMNGCNLSLFLMTLMWKSFLRRKNKLYWQSPTREISTPSFLLLRLASSKVQAPLAASHLVHSEATDDARRSSSSSSSPSEVQTIGFHSAARSALVFFAFFLPVALAAIAEHSSRKQT